MFRPAIPALLFCLTLAACSAPAPDEQTAATEQSQAAAEAAKAPPPADAAATPAPVPEGSCDDTQAQWIIGKAASPAELDQAGKDANAASVRSLKPGEAATMDFNPNRLNIDLDEKGVVTAVRCG